MTEERTVYTVSEVQKILRIGKNQAYSLVKEGVFPTKKIGRKILIPKAAFDVWLNN